MSQFLDLIKKDADQKRKLKFEGTFLKYLDKVKLDPSVTMLAHRRMYDIVTSKGVGEIKTGENPRLRRIYGSNDIIKKYNFFKEEFYGIDKTLGKIVQYFKAAALQGEEARQVLYLVGPVGSGKSSIMESLKKALEMSTPIYALKGCPMREEPLHLVPKHLRKQFEDMLNVQIEGDLCPVCRHRLKTEYNGEYQNFLVESVDFSIRSRKGIGVVPPVDPNNQDASVLIGSIDISKLDLYSEDDARVLSLNGAFNVGNRGLVEFIEVFKNEVEYLHTMITATQEKSIPAPGKASMIYFDGIILAHSNESEWNKFKADHTNEAILDRIVKVDVPYCLELEEEVKIYNKMLGKSKFDVHIAPHTVEIGAMFAILSRLGESAKIDPITKLKIYNGEEIVEKGTTKKVDIVELREEVQREGMTGISTRFIMKAIDTAITDSEHNCINPIAFIDTLVKAVKELELSEEIKKKYLGFLQNTIKKEYHKMLENEVTKAFIHGYREQAEDLFNNYLDHAEAFVNRKKIRDSRTGEELDPDEAFLKSIEEHINITGTAAKGFRQDVTAYMLYIMRNGGKLDYTCYEPLKEAIEKKLTSSVRELSRVITRTKVRDKEQSEKYNAMVEEMNKNGYCDHCCDVILKYAANNLWKD